MDPILEKIIRECLRIVNYKNSDNFTDEDIKKFNIKKHLIEDVGFDDLDNVELTIELEKIFGIMLPDEDVIKCNTAEDFFNLVKTQLERKNQNA